MTAARTIASPKVACETTTAAVPSAAEQIADQHRLAPAARDMGKTMADVVLAGRRQRVLAATQAATKTIEVSKNGQAEHEQRIIHVTVTLLLGKRSLIATAASMKPRKRLPRRP